MKVVNIRSTKMMKKFSSEALVTALIDAAPSGSNAPNDAETLPRHCEER
jgi:hypothetical protein